MRPLVCIQGLGFVGSAMAVAVASARNERGEPYYDVVGIDLPNEMGLSRINSLNDGRFPFETADELLKEETKKCVVAGNLKATSSEEAYAKASIVVVDVHCDLKLVDGKPVVNMDIIRSAMRTLGRHIQSSTLVIVETTVPPGTCERVILPELQGQFRERGLNPQSVLLAHSYERVMPGVDYLDSIRNYWRVFAGHGEEASVLCQRFLSRVINIEKYPLTRLGALSASETAKVLENSYRATNIAFIEEWGRFAEAIGIDLFEVIDAIRLRPTHSNMRQPGFGVGGYCITKDPAFGMWSAKNLFDLPNLDFPFCRRALDVNRDMPLVTLDKIRTLLGGSLEGRKILLMGLSYRQDVGDTRYSPSETLVLAAQKEGAIIEGHDPIVEDWPEVSITLKKDLKDLSQYDAVVFAVQHDLYRTEKFSRYLAQKKPLIFDANCVLTTEQRTELRQAGCKVESIGRGAGL